MFICAIAAAALSASYILTSSRIEEERSVDINRSLSEMVPGADSFSREKATVNGEEIDFYSASRKGKPAGLVVTVSQRGYGGTIDMLVGIDSAGAVSGVKVLKMAETPGLGTKASEPSFLDRFKGKRSDDELKAKYDIQAITGATITSQAVCDGVKKALKISGELR